MTKEDWAQAELELSKPWGRVELLIDGYTVSLVVGRMKPLKYCIAVYVNGFMKGEWVKGECEEAKRFLRPMVKRYYSPATVAGITKGLSKTVAQKFIKERGLDKTFTLYDLGWPSFGPMKRHLLANNTSIELVKSEVAA
ncbi:MAG: hypothetical protein U1E02_24350 [Hydrogenophaga sp.]|nr:hypothetical protein [Hydrogenophaga sp.]